VKRIFVDANVFLRFFTADNKGHHSKASALFKLGAAEKVILITGPPVIFELAWTLRASYKQSRQTVNDVISRILAFTGLKVTDAVIVEKALLKSNTFNVDLADCYIMALCEDEGVDEIATFNESDFRKLKGKLYQWET
jgi:predicted nucleic acid-binding protein